MPPFLTPKDLGIVAAKPAPAPAPASASASAPAPSRRKQAAPKKRAAVAEKLAAKKRAAAAAKKPAKAVKPAKPADPSAGDAKAAPVGAEPAGKRRRRARPGTAALREIRRLQKSSDLLIPRINFQRLVREVLSDDDPDQNTPRKLSREALAALQDASEAYLQDVFRAAYTVSLASKRVTLMPEDLVAAARVHSILGSDNKK